MKLSRDQIHELYNKVLTNIAGKGKGLDELNSYFLIYGNLFELIDKADISDEDKNFFRKNISNSMSKHEQLSLLWASVNIQSLNALIKDTAIFDQFYAPYLMPFFVNFFDKSCFGHPDIIKNWNK